MNFEVSRRVFEKYSTIKFHQNPSSGSRVVPCGRTERHASQYHAILITSCSCIVKPMFCYAAVSSGALKINNNKKLQASPVAVYRGMESVAKFLGQPSNFINRLTLILSNTHWVLLKYCLYRPPVILMNTRQSNANFVHFVTRPHCAVLYSSVHKTFVTAIPYRNFIINYYCSYFKPRKIHWL